MTTATATQKRTSGSPVCSYCHRPLKDPASIARGIGPECAVKKPKAARRALYSVAMRGASAPGVERVNIPGVELASINTKHSEYEFYLRVWNRDDRTIVLIAPVADQSSVGYRERIARDLMLKYARSLNTLDTILVEQSVYAGTTFTLVRYQEMIAGMPAWPTRTHLGSAELLDLIGEDLYDYQTTDNSSELVAAGGAS
jgi:hypothetical protein